MPRCTSTPRHCCRHHQEPRHALSPPFPPAIPPVQTHAVVHGNAGRGGAAGRPGAARRRGPEPRHHDQDHRRHLRHHQPRPEQDRDRVLDRERRLPGLGRRGRQHRHPLVQRVLRPAVAGGRPGLERLDHPGHPAVGGGLRDRVPDPDVAGRHELDHDLLHHHRHRRHPDPERDRHRPLRPHVRHGPGHPVRLLAVGVPGLRQPERRRHLRHRGRRPEPARHRLIHRERRLPGLGRGGRQHRHPLVQRLLRPPVAGSRPRAPARPSAG